MRQEILLEIPTNCKKILYHLTSLQKKGTASRHGLQRIRSTHCPHPVSQENIWKLNFSYHFHRTWYGHVQLIFYLKSKTGNSHILNNMTVLMVWPQDREGGVCSKSNIGAVNLKVWFFKWVNLIYFFPFLIVISWHGKWHDLFWVNWLLEWNTFRASVQYINRTTLLKYSYFCVYTMWITVCTCKAPPQRSCDHQPQAPSWGCPSSQCLNIIIILTRYPLTTIKY
jgi:hypothetical protein